MKKLLFLIAFMTATSAAISQNQVVRNSTACTFFVQVEYGFANCDATDMVTLVVLPFTQQLIGVPAGQVIIRSRGAYGTSQANINCDFHIGIPCSNYDFSEDVNCGTSCGDYTATLFPGLGISLQN